MRRRNLPSCLPLVALGLATPFGLSGQDAIASDRPGIGSGATVLGRAVLQLETGFSRATVRDVDRYALGELLVRLGVGGLELQAFGNSLVVQRGDGSVLDREGLQDVGVGAKIPVARGVGERLNLSLHSVVMMPTGSDFLSSHEWVGSISALADVSLTGSAGVSVNVGAEAASDRSAEVFSVIVTPAISLGRGFGAYAGWAGFFSEGPDTSFGEAGLTYLADRDVQLDVNGGWNLDRDEWFLGAGLALRWGAS